MCGIAGVRRFDSEPVSRELLANMAARLLHRGPGATGIWTQGDVGFAHTRLSIIDVLGSQRPMAGAGGHTHLVFNGEILNYRELRAGLSYPFRTRGDTEVLLAQYEKYGPDGVNRLRGQFAYAIHDSATSETHLFRDRLGILPLYYYVNNDVFAFASEIKALLPVIGAPRVDEDSLHDYLAHRSVPAPYTLIAGVRKVPPGHHLVVKQQGGWGHISPCNSHRRSSHRDGRLRSGDTGSRGDGTDIRRPQRRIRTTVDLASRQYRAGTTGSVHAVRSRLRIRLARQRRRYLERDT